ncbi:MAG: hypothetical protein KC613_10330, partial [Myxococcales bacterium]|nr:hypothetical protein [Myxococcales bacterium]
DCDLEAAALRGALRVAVEPGALGSGRPVRLDLVDPRGDRFSVQLADNHARLAATPDGQRAGPFAVTVDAPAGRYRGVVYLDTDRDGAFRACPDDPFGDRAVVDAEQSPILTDLQVGPGVVLDLGALILDGLGCPAPEAGLTPTVILSGDIEPPNRPVRLRIEEQGGFVDDVLLLVNLGEADRPISAARRPLAPGVYRLIAYVDTNDNGVYDACDSNDFDAISGRVDVTIGAMDAEVAPRFSLGVSCGG